VFLVDRIAVIRYLCVDQQRKTFSRLSGCIRRSGRMRDPSRGRPKPFRVSANLRPPQTLCHSCVCAQHLSAAAAAALLGALARRRRLRRAAAAAASRGPRRCPKVEPPLLDAGAEHPVCESSLFLSYLFSSFSLVSSLLSLLSLALVLLIRAPKGVSTP
jgi:hypothetical protein